MIERGEWVRCDAAIDRPRPGPDGGAITAAEIADRGDVNNLRRCEKHLAFLTGQRQQGWALARERGWATIADPRYPGVIRNVCPRHAHTPPAVLVLMPLRQANRDHVEDVALALVDATEHGQALAAELEQRRQRDEHHMQPADLVELRAREQRHEALRRQMEQQP